ncbi:MAG: S41 family peptidase, partial [Rhodothermaceae bacterium]|nr:S41 family peptidase [Rhodothermaceae bacterium]
IPSGRSIQAIDYKFHDGDFEEIPDSLRRTFQTEAGRLVKDGRGIEPDIEILAGHQSELEQALTRKAAFFFFANHFAATHPEIATDFVVDNAVYDAFKQWLQDENFTYRTGAERAADELAEHLSAMAYDETSDEFETLEKAIAEEKAADFTRHENQLKERIRTEILARYYGDTAQVEASLTHDLQYKEAVTVLLDNKRYKNALRP